MGSLPGTGQASLVHRMVLPLAAQAPGMARDGTLEVLGSLGLGHLAEDAILLVSELVSNAVRHTAGSGPSLELRIAMAEARLRIEVLDCDPRPPQPRTPGALDESGRGFLLVEALADDWGVSQTETGKSVWIELRTDADAGPAAPYHWSGTRVSAPASTPAAQPR